MNQPAGPLGRVSRSTGLRVTMVKKRLVSGEPCQKCKQAEELLRRRGLWDLVDEVVVAEEGQPDSRGMQLAAEHGVDLAPFYIVTDEGRAPRVITATMEVVKLLAAALAGETPDSAPPSAAVAVDGGAASFVESPHAEGRPAVTREEVERAQAELDGRTPQQVLRWVLERLGPHAPIAFSGAEDVVLIDMAVELGLPFSVFCLDTGRLHPETYRFIDRARQHYGVEIALLSPEPAPVEALVRRKGLFSFYDDGHTECCGVRKVSTLRRHLAGVSGWITGQRRDQSPTRADVPVLSWDESQNPRGIAKANPLAEWSLDKVWKYLRAAGAPYNELHDRGFVSIGCEPCTRPPRPGEHERAGRWWWEEATKRECGLHK